MHLLERSQCSFQHFMQDRGTTGGLGIELLKWDRADRRCADHNAVSSQSLTMYMKPSSKTIWMMRNRPARTLAICRAQAPQAGTSTV